MELDHSLQQLRDGDVNSAMAGLFSGLASRKASSTESEWRDFVTKRARSHPLQSMIHQDPLTTRVYSKPRGYPGDAVMLDFIYGSLKPGRGTSRLGRRIFAFNYKAEAARAVRHRRSRLAELIDGTAQVQNQPRVLALAAGHLREAEISRALQERRISKLIALDQDAESVSRIASSYGSLNVQPKVASVREIVARSSKWRNFDLVYAAGLFDYLGQPFARRLTRAMFEATRSGGRIFIANFSEGILSAGFMECFMDWFLLYRSNARMFDLLGEIPQAEIASVCLHRDPDRNITYLEATRA